jgi:hypothetical protein
MLPYIGTALGQASNLLAAGSPQYYPGNPVAGFSDPQQQAFAGIQDLANNGSAYSNAAGNFDTSLLNGQFNGPQAQLASMGTGSMNNPELSNLLSLGNQRIADQYNSEFGQAGRNAEASMPLQGEAMGNFDANLLGSAYNTNQANALAANQVLGGQQMNALFGAPSLNAMQQGNLAAEAGVGQQVQSLAQQMINANQNMYNFYQTQPYQQLQQYESFLSGLQPGSQNTSPYFNNPTANTLNNAAGLASLIGTAMELFA